MVNLKLKCNFVEKPRKFIIAKFAIRKLGTSSGCVSPNDILNFCSLLSVIVITNRCIKPASMPVGGDRMSTP